MTAPAAVILNPAAGTAAFRTNRCRNCCAGKTALTRRLWLPPHGRSTSVLLAKKFLRGRAPRTLVAGGGATGRVSSVASAVAGTGRERSALLPLGTLEPLRQGYEAAARSWRGAVRNLRTGVEAHGRHRGKVNGAHVHQQFGTGVVSVIGDAARKSGSGWASGSGWRFFPCVGGHAAPGFRFLEVRLALDGDVFAIRTPFRIRGQQHLSDGGNRPGVPRVADRGGCSSSA